MSAAVKRDRVFCIEESIWVDATGLADGTSVLPTLETAPADWDRVGVRPPPRAGTTEFENYLSWRMLDRKVRNFGTIYLAFHGSRDGLAVGEETVSFERLAARLGTIPRAVVHLGSCSVLRGNEDGSQGRVREIGVVELYR